MRNQIVQRLMLEELHRQNEGIELIASENYVSRDVREAMGSIFTNKYAEGYPGKRYYGGCDIVDKLEEYAQALCRKLFGCKYVNVQPHSGSQANYAAYHALLPKGGKIMSLELNDGGHLTHGSPVSFSANDYYFVHYSLDEHTGKIDYDELQRLAELEKPDVILSGFSAFPYIIDFAKIKNICKSVGAKMMVDMAHIAGLIATGNHPSPALYADVITSTTHKTLRGPRGGIIMTNDVELYKKINSAVFPYSQGGPLEHTIAAKAVCFEEALDDEFIEYCNDIIKNTHECMEALRRCGAKTSGTETHLFLLNTYDSYGLTGLQAQEKLESIGITTNKNMLPGDTLKPNQTSGLRIGFAAVTTRGCTKKDANAIGELIHLVLSDQITRVEAEAKVRKIIRDWKNIDSL